MAFLYSTTKNRMEVLGIDIGGTTVKFGKVDADGNITSKSVYDTTDWEDNKGFAEHLVDAVEEYLQKETSIKKVGLGFPGLLSLDRENVILLPNIPNMENVPIKPMLEKRIPGVEFQIENDAKCAAMGEYIFGAMGDIDTFVMITLGTGVGSGAVMHGKLFPGGNGNPMEAGHVLVSTGKTLEQELGLAHLSNYARKKLVDYPTSSLNGKEINPKVIADAAEEGDELSIHVYERMGELLGESLISMIRLLDINTIVLGGGVAGASKYFLPKTMEKLNTYLPDYYTKDLDIHTASLSNEAGILGAASLVMSKKYKVLISNN